MSVLKDKVPQENPLVKCISCDSSRIFLDEISLLNERFRKEYKQWIFRGLSTRKYRLIPSVLRDDKNIKAILDFSSPSLQRRRLDPEDRLPKCFGQQADRELWLLSSFYEALNEQGLQIPNNTPLLRELLNESPYGNKILLRPSTWYPPDELFELMALAQHYGLPTRLLDWTRNPLAAAYFAAIGGIENLLKPERNEAELNSDFLVVWAFKYYYPSLFSYIGQPSVKHRIKTVNPPTFANPNLRAQQGLFTVLCMLSEKGQVDESLDRLPLDSQLFHLISMNNPHAFSFLNAELSPFFHFSLPVSEAPELVKQLRVLGIHGSSLFPGLAGVAKGVKEESMVNAVIERY